MKPRTDLADAIPHTPTSDHPPLACRNCQSLTSRATLANHGGLCYPCYRAYQRTSTATVPNAFQLPTGGEESATVRDMKTRLREHIGNQRKGSA